MLHRYWLSVRCRFYRVNNDEGKKYQNDNELDLKTCRGWARGLALHRHPFHNSTSRKCFYHISCKNAACSVIWDTQSQRFCSVIIHTGSKWAARVTPSNSSELWFWFYWILLSNTTSAFTLGVCSSGSRAHAVLQGVAHQNLSHWCFFFTPELPKGEKEFNTYFRKAQRHPKHFFKNLRL